eukprot:CAMPEP_0201585680 /NCGR_PEP_ID=MMETSP0190_2-20130828/124520_1 /ASSEMBLY_ACC=CAM_ASM_000263 /TAXON_ID=37353 /ORGANISM="Rosalina sp." /LENGTH=189 /DNA_ID=CAMNT_0048032105 /DNA_START=68 /DNA_END=637 /DNA_ORIENTATION=-
MNLDDANGIVRSFCRNMQLINQNDDEPYKSWKLKFTELTDKLVGDEIGEYLVKFHQIPNWSTCPGINFDTNAIDFGTIFNKELRPLFENRKPSDYEQDENQNDFKERWNKLLTKKQDVPHDDYVWVDVPATACVISQQYDTVSDDKLDQNKFNLLYNLAKETVEKFPQVLHQVCPDFPEIDLGNNAHEL